MKTIRWNTDKATWLKKQPGRNNVGFEECAVLIEAEDILDDIANPSKNFPTQRAFVLAVEGYVYLVPYVEDDDGIFLKTVFPNRKMTDLYLGETDP